MGEQRRINVATTPPTRRCPHLISCELFPKFAKRASLKVWQTFYCEGNYESCARFKLSLRSLPVSPNLLPNGRELNLAVLGV
jgi:hypothetical protein